MFTTFINAFKIKDLRKKILFTLLLLVIYRLGSAIPIPGVDAAAWAKQIEGLALFDFMSLLSGSALSQFTVFAMGISPYITASIIMQLLVPVVPSLEKLSREGEVGRGRINQYTRYLTILICVIQGAMAAVAMTRPSNLGLPAPDPAFPLVTNPGFGFIAMSVCILTAGTMILVWLGERITEHGIGNGVSIIITINIIERLPQALVGLYEMMISGATAGGGRFRPVHLLILLMLFAVVTALTVILNQGQRRIPIQMAKKIVGSKMTGGSTYIPLKVNFSGVMPIIFASSILSLPPTINLFVGAKEGEGWYDHFFKFFSSSSWVYVILYFLLIIFFAYFYASIQYNPIEMANNIRKNSGAIPGIRPGKPTSDYIQKILSRITLLGALLLSVVALFPLLFQLITSACGKPMNVSLGGTSIIILVGVAIETVKQLESQMMMRHYKGFLD